MQQSKRTTQREVQPINIASLLSFLTINPKNKDSCLLCDQPAYKYSSYCIKCVASTSYSKVKPMMVFLLLILHLFVFIYFIGFTCFTGTWYI